MKRVILTFSVCVIFVAALVPRERPEPEQPPQQTTEATTAAPVICAPETPCAWSTYHPVSKFITQTINNTYCVCAPDLECQITDDDTNVHAYVLRCRTPVSGEEEEENSES